MKKVLLSLLLFAITVMSSFAQHLQFMGIPLDGNINSFHSKLIAKGLKIDPDNKSLGVGKRLYCGTFAGHKAQIMVAYDSVSKCVFGACVVFKSVVDSKEAINDYMSCKKDLAKKYGNDKIVESKIDADKLIGGLISEHIVYLTEGTIKLKLEQDEYNLYRNYIFYTDYDNLQKANDNEEKRNSDDY